MSEAFKATSDLGKAMEAVSASASGLSTSFADLAENGKIWTIMSRVISGTGMWQLQNKIRAVGQTMHYWNNLQEKGIENQIKSMEANMKLAKSYKDISNAMKKSSSEIEKTDLYQMYFQQGKMQGRSDPGKWALGQYQARHGEMKERLGGMLKGVGKQNRTMQYLRGTGSDKRQNKAGRWINKKGQFAAKADFTTRGQFLTSQIPGFKMMAKMWKKELSVKAALSGIKKKIFKVGGKILPFAGRFLLVATTFFVKGMLYFLLIALGIALVVKIIRSVWPSIKKTLDQLGVVKTMISGIKLVLGGFFQMVKGIFKGNFSDVVKGFLKIMLGLGKILFAVALGLVGLLIGVVRGIVNKIIGKLHGAPVVGGFFKKRLKKFAMGGVSSGGMALVGERGPELVNLPAGARVHSNQASRRMGGGNTIHVHVNGRVGASDMEIRDIAQKVAREIGLQMNRTSSAVGRF